MGQHCMGKVGTVNNDSNLFYNVTFQKKRVNFWHILEEPPWLIKTKAVDVIQTIVIEILVYEQIWYLYMYKNVTYCGADKYWVLDMWLNL